MQHLNEGLDPTPLDCITVSALLQMIRNAYPVVGQGWIIWSQTAPDVVADPQLAYFWWAKLDGSNVFTKEVYYYDGVGWEQLPFNDGSLLAAGSVLLSALNLTGSDPLQIIQVNGAGDALVWTDVIDAIQNNTVTPAKLATVADTNKYVMTSQSGVNSWALITALATLFNDNSIPINKLVFGAANTWLQVNPTATGLQWVAIDISNITATGFTAGQALRRNAGNTGWEGYTPITTVGLTKSYNSGLLTVPVAPTLATTPVNHGLATMPAIVHAKFVCASEEHGYLVGDELPLNNINVRSSDDDFHFHVVANSTQIIVYTTSDTNYVLVGFSKADGTVVQFTPGNWRIKISAYA